MVFRENGFSNGLSNGIGLLGFWFFMGLLDFYFGFSGLDIC